MNSNNLNLQPFNVELEHAGKLVSELSGLRVLLVEDDSISCMVANELLTDLGVQVVIAENGQQAVQKATSEVFDLILMDVLMPKMDGFTATSLIRASHALQKLPIIAMTSYTRRSDQEKCLAAGMNDYLSKPIEPKQLANMLKKWIQPKSSVFQTPQSVAQTQEINKDALPSTLPPFNIAAALARMNGNSEVLRKLILMFRDNHATVCQDLAQLLVANHYEEAQRQAHTLKGAAMMLAVEELATIAGMVEQAIQKRDIRQTNHLLKVLEAVIMPAIEAASLLDGK